MPRTQRTLAADARVAGVGFFTNCDCEVRFVPASPESGVTFARVDLPGAPTVPAEIAFAVDLPRRTAVRRGGAEVQLTEHVLAALAGLRVDNCRVELTGPELPGLDGSAAGFADALLGAGFVEQDGWRRTLTVRRAVTVTAGAAALTALPRFTGAGWRVGYHLDCGPDHPVPPQAFAAEISPETFAAEIAPARTFVAAAEVPALRAAGYGARVDERDLLVFEPDGSVRGNAPRFGDEPARHKLLDVIGDLALLGCDLDAAVVSQRGGHALNRDLGRALLAAVGTGAAEWTVGGNAAGAGPALPAFAAAA